jgi:hypothetical protein
MVITTKWLPLSVGTNSASAVLTTNMSAYLVHSLHEGEAMRRDEIENRFSHHAPANNAVGDMHSELRAVLKSAAYKVDLMVPEGREHSLMMTKLEEAMMWGNAGIARYGTKPHD